MTSPHRDQPRVGKNIPVGEIRFEFDIRRAEGAEAKRLSLEQARVLWEVNQWLAAQRQSKPGQDRAA